MSLFTSALISMLIPIHIGFYIAVKHRRNDVADSVWGLGFIFNILGAVVFRIYQNSFKSISVVEILLILAVIIWGARLSHHLATRSLKAEEEDERYRQMRYNWGNRWIWNTYTRVFLLQGFFMYLICSPLLWELAHSPQPFNFRVFLGLLVWIVGFTLETLSDRQLKEFKSNPENKGRLMTEGLWAWSRHPNYFGEVVQWWGLFLMACFSVAATWTVVSPIVMTFLILKVSGVPLLEKLMENRPGFEEYKKQTSIFFPRKPRRKPDLKVV